MLIVAGLDTVQRVYAIGKPPEDQICLFKHLKNVVVLPSAGAEFSIFKLDSMLKICAFRLQVSSIVSKWRGC